MRTPFSRLEERVNWFGNHHRKYLRFIQAKQSEVIYRLEEKGLIEQIHLWTPTGDRFSKEMRLIQSVGTTHREKLNFAGWYYSTQFLLMNIRAIDVLSLNLTLGQNRIKEYRQFMKQIGGEFRNLTAVYMSTLLNLFLPKSEQPEFAILGVGTRADQDDIDLGIVDDGSEKRHALNQAIGLMQNEMLKHASRLHLYLSEYVGTQFYSASIDEYDALLSDEIHDFIIISEMLGAALIMGSKPLFHNFQQLITNRYYYQKNQNNKYHEGYLRGILGEIRSLLARKITSDRIHLKNDALRIIKALAYAGKSICGIQRVNAWDILDLLSLHQPKRKAEYQALDNALSFFEIFRFLYQLAVVQEDEIYLQEKSDIDRLEMVAEIMGYQKVGVKRASDFLLVQYYENMEVTKKVAAILINDFSRHLKSITVFRNLFSVNNLPAHNFQTYVHQISKTTHFFRGTTFWEDVFQILTENEGRVLTGFVQKLLALGPQRVQVYCRLFARAAKDSFLSFFQFLVLLANHRSQPDCQLLFDLLNNEFLQIVCAERHRGWRIARLYNYDQRLINNYIMALSEEKQKQFIALLEQGDIYTKEDLIFKDKLKNLGELYFNNSRYFRRYFLTVINKYPKFIEYIDDIEQLRKFAKGFLGSVDSFSTFKEKKAKLRDSFALDFFRIGLATLEGHRLDYIESEFVTAIFHYLQELHNICKQDVQTELGQQLMTRDLFAIFVAGSLGREQAFEDDLDLIVLLNSNNHELRAHCSKVITRMNREIIRQAILPHYRFVEHFGHYVTLMSELEQFLKQDNTNCFIEKAQLLGARMMVGSSRFEKVFVKRIIEPHIYNDKKNFIKAMIQEFKERHDIIRSFPDLKFSVKECYGGLRDIEMILLIYKAHYRLDEPINRKIIDAILEREPTLQAPMNVLAEAYDFFKAIRNIYRLAVAAKNTIDPAYLERPAQIMGFRDTAAKTAAEQLVNKFQTMSRQSTEVIQQLLNDFTQKVDLL